MFSLNDCYQQYVLIKKVYLELLVQCHVEHLLSPCTKLFTEGCYIVNKKYNHRPDITNYGKLFKISHYNPLIGHNNIMAYKMIVES